MKIIKGLMAIVCGVVGCFWISQEAVMLGAVGLTLSIYLLVTI